jgi:CRISPR type I-E-associated protein CasB/Cse2
VTDPKDPLQALARQIASDRADTGMLARVRRSSPGAPEAMFDTQTLLHAAGIDPAPSDWPAWALLAHCLALVGGAHQSGVSTGEVLAEIRLTELRMRLLVEADDTLLRDLLPRLARRLAASGQRINWWPFANLLGLGAHTPDEARRELIRGYLRTSAAAH